MNIKDIMSIVTVALMAVGCSSDDGLQSREGRVPITLSASVGTEVTTRGVQETALASGETVYVWGKEGSGNYDYLQAWTLTAGADGALSGSAKYYPLSGETLTMVALHGNFSYTEGDALPASISHSVELDQSSTGNYEKSDLLWAAVSGSSEDASSKNLAFIHMLSKVEIKLHPGEGYSDISAAEVRLRGVNPTIAINPTDGSLGEASGTATLIKARKTEDHLSEGSPYAVYEAIIPPQAAPTAFLNIKIGDKVATVAADVATFASNKRYVYDITITEFKVNVTSSIASWGYDASGSQVNADVTNDKVVQIGRPKLPIEYVGEHNMATGTTMASDDKAISSGFFMWGTNKDTKTATFTKFFNGTALSGYHLPTQPEWAAILPAMCSFKSGKSTNNSENVRWGVTNNNGTYTFDVDRTYYCDYNFPNDEAHAYIGYGLKLRELTGGNYVNGIYTCAYRYEYKVKQNDQDGPSLEIRVKYVGKNATISIDAISDENYWGATQDFLCVIPACGHTSNVEYASGSTYSGSTAAWYWTYSGYDTNRGRDIYFNVDKIQADSYDGTTTSASVRLFKDVGTP